MKPFIKGPQCTGLLDNHMQCIRPAVIRQEQDTENKNSLCYVCWALQGKPAVYDTPVDPSVKLNF